jgi:hypothetical protein
MDGYVFEPSLIGKSSHDPPLGQDSVIESIKTGKRFFLHHTKDGWCAIPFGGYELSGSRPRRVPSIAEALYFEYKVVR